MKKTSLLIFIFLCLLGMTTLSACSSSKSNSFDQPAGADVDKGAYPQIIAKGKKLRKKYRIKQSNFKVLSAFRRCRQDSDCIETNIATCNRGCPCAFDSISVANRRKFYRFRKYVCYGYEADDMCVCDSRQSGQVPKCVEGLCKLAPDS